MICSDCAVLINSSSTRPQERWRDIAQSWQTAKQISKIIISRFQQPPCLFPAPYPRLSPLLYPLSVFIDIVLILYKYRYSIWTVVLIYFQHSLNSMGKLVHRKWIEKKHLCCVSAQDWPIDFHITGMSTQTWPAHLLFTVSSCVRR